jgi:hypothetical protein
MHKLFLQESRLDRDGQVISYSPDVEDILQLYLESLSGLGLKPKIAIVLVFSKISLMVTSSLIIRPDFMVIFLTNFSSLQTLTAILGHRQTPPT